MKKLKKKEKEDLCLIPPLSETRANLFSFAKRKLDYINSFIFYVFSLSLKKCQRKIMFFYPRAENSTKIIISQ